MMRAATALGSQGIGRLPTPLAVAGAVGVVITVIAEVVMLERGSMWAYAALGLLAIGVGALLFADHVYEVFLAWIVLEGLAFPFIRYPHYSAPFVTFDRYVVLALGCALLMHRGPRMSKYTRQLAIAFGLFTVAYGARAVTTDQLLLPAGLTPSSSLQPEADWLDSVLLPFVVFLVAARTITPSRWPTLAKALTLGGVAIGSIAILQWIFGFELATIAGVDAFKDGTAGIVRAGGPYPQPTALGSVMIVCMVGTLYWLQTERAYALAGTALGIELLGLLPGYTKTVWAAAFVVILIGVGVRNRVSSRTALVAIYAITAVGLIYFFVKSSPVVAARVSSTAAEDNFLGRLATWKQALYMFERWPLFGVGTEQFIGGQLLVPRPTVGGTLPVPSAHNTFLSLLAEGGLLVVAPLTAVIFTAVRVMRACRRFAVTHADSVFRVVLLGGMVGSVFLSMTFSEIYEPPAFMFVALLLGVAAARVDHLVRLREGRGASG